LPWRLIVLAALVMPAAAVGGGAAQLSVLSSPAEERREVAVTVALPSAGSGRDARAATLTLPDAAALRPVSATAVWSPELALAVVAAPAPTLDERRRAAAFSAAADLLLRAPEGALTALVLDPDAPAATVPLGPERLAAVTALAHPPPAPEPTPVAAAVRLAARELATSGRGMRAVALFAPPEQLSAADEADIERALTAARAILHVALAEDAPAAGWRRIAGSVGGTVTTLGGHGPPGGASGPGLEDAYLLRFRIPAGVALPADGQVHLPAHLRTEPITVHLEGAGGRQPGPERGATAAPPEPGSAQRNWLPPVLLAVAAVLGLGLVVTARRGGLPRAGRTRSSRSRPRAVAEPAAVVPLADLPVTSYPLGVAYQDALQAPEVALSGTGLETWTVLRDRLGMPQVTSGAFGVVFELHGPRGVRRALKCFTRAAPDVGRRYSVLAADLDSRRLPHLVDFTYLPAGVLVDGRRFPLLTMDWVEGVSLLEYVEVHRFDPGAVAALAERFRAMVRRLETAGIAHGDLQHDNIIVRADGSLRLIDYDGMYVPALAGAGASERGLADYQSPRRRDQFGPYLDRFSAWVIYLSLRALVAQPELWTELRPAGEERLLLSAADFTAWVTSPTVQRLRTVPDAVVQSLLDQVEANLHADLAEVPPLAVAGAPSRVDRHRATRAHRRGGDPSRKRTRTKRAQGQHAARGGRYLPFGWPLRG